MRIAYVCADNGVPVFGKKGSSVHVQEVVRALCGRGGEVDLFASRTEGIRPPDLGGVRLHALLDSSRGNTSAREDAALQANCALYDSLEREGPFDFVYERYSLWSYAGMTYARQNDLPGLLEVNAPLIEEQARHRRLVRRADAELIAERVFSNATAIIAVSEEIAAHLRSYPASRGRVNILPNGVSAHRFAAKADPTFPAPPGTFTVGFVGTLKPWHGLPLLVEAFAALPQSKGEVRMLIVGDGPERGRVEMDLKARGLQDKTLLTGAVAPDAIPGLLASMDAAVAPYSDRQGFYFSPLKVYEYMAAGLPVVTSRVGQMKDLITDGENGLLCEPGDVVAFTTGLERLRNDVRFRRHLGEAARSLVLKHHTWDKRAQRILELAGSTKFPTVGRS